MGRFLELDSLDNTSIVAATLVGTYTATGDIDVYCTLYAQGLAGGGDYVYYATFTPSGLSEGEGQKTTQTLGATTYQLFGQSIPVSLRNGDALKVYLKGLAGDGAAPDIRVNFYESPSLQPTTAGNKADVQSTGEVALDFSNIKVAANPTTLTNITVPVVTDVGTVLGDVEGDIYGDVQGNLDGSVIGKVLGGGVYPLTGTAVQAQLETDGITAAKIATDAVTKIQAGIGAQVWSYATRTLTSLSALLASIAADVWAYTSRTLTQPAAQVIAAVSGSTLTFYRDATFEAKITGLGNIADVSKLWITVKRQLGDLDKLSVLQIEMTAGLVYINQQTIAIAGSVASDGSLAVDNTVLGNITINLKVAAAAKLPPWSSLVYDIKILRTTGDVDILSGGSAHVLETPTKTIV